MPLGYKDRKRPLLQQCRRRTLDRVGLHTHKGLVGYELQSTVSLAENLLPVFSTAYHAPPACNPLSQVDGLRGFLQEVENDLENLVALCELGYARLEEQWAYHTLSIDNDILYRDATCR